MKMNITNLGLFLALLTSHVDVLEAAAEAPLKCDRAGNCPEDHWCHSVSGDCMKNGSCTDVADCDNPNNSYGGVLCIGTKTCNDSKCGVDCGVGELPVGAATQVPSEAFEGTVCSTDDDCVDRDDHFCASDGFCASLGGCAIAEDCFVDANPIAIPLCMGGMECNNRTCVMDCSGGSDALFGCNTTEDCPVPEHYCDSYGTCRANGRCTMPDDCGIPDNFFMRIECVGPYTCEMGICGKTCSDGGGGGTGVFPILPEPETPCMSTSDCEGDDYCAGNGYCLEPMACDREGDCSHPDNSFMSAACVGSFSCDSGMCAKNCNTDEAKTPDNNMGSPLKGGANCSSDADCVSFTTSTTRAADGTKSEYCAQGVCMSEGSCLSDSDCINPSNILWNDVKCMGYLQCVPETGTCNRVCGQSCKSGASPIACFENPCDAQPLCEGAVSCTMTTCDKDCKALYFDPAGEVFDCNAATGGAAGAPERGSELTAPTKEMPTVSKNAGDGTDTDLTTISDPDGQVFNLKTQDSSSIRSTASVSALLVAVVLAVIVV